jgi:predicted TIM-barrel fold metal-dependent hydrolase
MNRRSFLSAGLETVAVSGALANAAPAGEDGQSGKGEPTVESPIDPGLPIIDAHHHVYDYPALAGRPASRFLLDELLADIAAGGHHITQTVCVETMAMYRASGPVALRSLGETEFINGIAAMSASGNFGPCRVAAGIVSNVDLRLGDAARPVLEAHLAAAGNRLKGVRNSGAWDVYPVMGFALDPARAGWLLGRDFRRGVALLAAQDLAFETWVFHTQIPQVTDLAAAMPDTRIVLSHLGTPIGVGPYADHPEQTFADWKRNLIELAKRPNVSVKLGGLGMAFVSPALAARRPPAGSAEIAERWRPFVEVCIEHFGAERCMFESNYPPDSATCSYGTLWNVFKRIAAGCSAAEKAALFSGTAARVYRLESV